MLKSKRQKKAGQSLVEYILMLALLSTVTTGFINFLTKKIFADGLNALPNQANGLLSNVP